MTPGDYVEAARVDAARRILEESDTPLKKIASMCGFPDQAGLRRAFMRQIFVTPGDYRHRFRPAGATVVPFAQTPAQRNARATDRGRG